MSETPLQPAPPIPPGRLWLQRMLTALFALLLGLPLFQQVTRAIPESSLAGVEFRLPKPVFSWPAWFDGRYAANVEKWLQGVVAFRGTLVHLACQANYSLFNRVGLSGGTEITCGRKHWLYETAYIKSAVRQPDFSAEKAARLAKRAAKLSQKLAARGIAFAVVIAPSKAEVLPEHLPASVKLPPRSSDTAYARITRELEKQNVPVLDVRSLFIGLKKTEPHLFPKTGTHWSAYSAWLAWQQVAGVLEARQPGTRFVSPPPALVMSPPLGSDDDLLRLSNLWRFEPGGPKPLPYPVVPPPPPEWRDRYQAVVVGDSFCLTMVDAMARSGLFRQIDVLYYFQRRFTYPVPSFEAAPDRLLADTGIDMGSLDVAHLDWKPLLDNRQLVLLVINELHLKNMGWGSIGSMLAALDKTAP